MNIQSIIVLAAVLIAVAAAIFFTVKNRGNSVCSGCTGCCDNCRGCTAKK